MMPRRYPELLSDDPAWPELRAALDRAGPRVDVLPAGEQREACLVALQVTTRSTLGAIAHETGGLLVDGGWLRVLGSGCARLPRALGAWNEQLGVALADALLIADDVAGGFFAINGGALAGAPGHVHYLAPDSGLWEDLGTGHSRWLTWILEGDPTRFYESLRWPGWQQDVAGIDTGHMLHTYPPPWSREGRAGRPVSRRLVPAREMFTRLVGRS